LEKKELAFWTVATGGTIITAAIEVANYLADHPISIPLPQGNATTSQYITILIPRVIRPFPSPEAWALLIFIGAAFAIAVGMRTYNWIRPPKPVFREPPQIEMEKASETVPLASNAEKLRALSPIHMMIMAIERFSPREASFGPYTGSGIGRFVPLNTPNLNLDKVRSTFADHADILGDHHLKEWLKFDEQIREYVGRGGFWVGRSEWQWLNELEREYQDAANANLSQTAPEIEVKISPPFVCDPRQLAYLLREEVPSLQVYRCQCLTVKATTAKVKSLMAKTRIDGSEPYFLNWAPKASEPTSDNPKRVDLFREEEVQLLVWYAPKQLLGPEKGFRFLLTIPSHDRLFEFELGGLEKLTIGIAIQFIAENYTDAKPRQFKLNARAWDELCLTD
jgi:hypothetical protein